MKTDLASLKKEFKRLRLKIGDVAELKKELNRLSTDIRGFDLSTALPTAQRARLDKRYRELKKTLNEMQKRLDQSFSKVSSLVRNAASRTSPGKTATTTSKKKTSRKVARTGPARKKVSKKVTRRSK